MVFGGFSHVYFQGYSRTQQGNSKGRSCTEVSILWGKKPQTCDMSKFLHHRHLLRCDLALLWETALMFLFVVWRFFCVGFFFGFNSTNINSESFFPRLALGEGSSFSHLFNPQCLWLECRGDPGTAPPEFIFPRESPKLGTAKLERESFATSTTRGQPLPPSRV